MRTKIITAIFVLATCSAFAQKLTLEKASPFTAVKWENDQPIVQFNNDWYHFEKLDHLAKKEILDFCKKRFAHKWQKRFSEDLVEVLLGLNYVPNKQVELELSKEGVTKKHRGTFTFENRELCLMFNKNNKASKPTQLNKTNTIDKTQAIRDLKQFQDILDSKSSYAQLHNYDYRTAIKDLAASIFKKGNVNIDELTNEMGKIMSEIGDRHSSIKNESFVKENYKTYNLRLPFGVSALNEKLVAVKRAEKGYIHYYNSYPFIESINGIAIETLINAYNYRAKKAPKESKLLRGSFAIQKYGELLFKNNIKCTDSVTIVFSNGTSNKTETFQLTKQNKGYVSKSLVEHYNNSKKIANGDFEGLTKLLGNNIGYINVPAMEHYDEVSGLEDFIENTLQRFSSTKALIIDVRNNPGGGREILQTFAQYFVQPEQSPWVANVAYLRTDVKILGDEKSMHGRYLYTYNSDKLSDVDREAIKIFNKNFETQKTFDHSKFSNPFYMVLNSGKLLYTKPVYILVNENSFSAATVFTSAFKGLPNVKIVGVTTDGSSGNSRKFYLTHSNIRIRVSTMLSFQRNGKTLDGNGTDPDIYIPINFEQILDGKDTQLKKLVNIINDND